MTKILIKREKFDVGSATVIDRVEVNIESDESLQSVSDMVIEKYNEIVGFKLEKSSKSAV